MLLYLQTPDNKNTYYKHAVNGFIIVTEFILPYTTPLTIIIQIWVKYFSGRDDNFASFLSTTAPSCASFPSLLRGFCHIPAACWESSCSRRCCSWQRCPWLSGRWPLACFVFGPGSRRSRRGRASGCRCRSTPGRRSHSQWTGSSKGSRAGLWWDGAQNKIRSLSMSLIWNKSKKWDAFTC